MTAIPNCLMIPCPRPTATRRLVVFPHAGGGANFYRAWGERFGPDVEVWIVQYPGRESRMAEPFVSDLDELVGEISAGLRATGNGPGNTALFGHSMGATIAYETALALAGGLPLDALFVSARRAPGSGPVSEARARPRTDEEILAVLRQHGGTPMEIFDQPLARELFLPVLRNDYLLLDSYRPEVGRPLLDIPIIALSGRQDSSVEAESVMGWGRFTTAEFHSHALDGGHFYLVPQVDRVVELVRAHLRDYPLVGKASMRWNA
ncbi:thioesterase II family protein [Streptomyces silvisoli]|uniref:Alpha/beta fold hydrolase n=1 Tax=Streptomyces silvisoli TaxID=3034235 RepID=A0ABT5ZL45_9ACTN|nr:alpha/beta fold hydrolase [Streptomyces silvisoli]MDF3290550.1 alpha/beta fold hydrolase [Streptomyces silvisoli]